MQFRNIFIASGLILLVGCSKPEKAAKLENSSTDQATLSGAVNSDPSSLHSQPLAIKDYIKCGVAASVLEDSILKDAIDFKGTRDQVNQPAASQTMRLSEDYRNELEPQGSSSDPVFAVNKATQWRNLDTCQVFINEYYAYLNHAAATYGKSILAGGDATSACSRFQEQYGLAHLAMPESIKAKIQAGVQATLNDANAFIKPYQAAYLAQTGSGAFTLNDYCTAHPDSTLKEAMQQATAVLAIESPATIQIKNMIQQSEQDEQYSGCASPQASNIEQKICINHLYKQALQTAYDTSTGCDREINGASCNDKPEQLISQALQPLVRTELDKIETALKAIIANPSTDPNADYQIDQLAEPCKQNLVQQGISGNEYEQQSKQVCLKQAQSRYLTKYKQQLVEVKEEMKKYS